MLRSLLLLLITLLLSGCSAQAAAVPEAAAAPTTPELRIQAPGTYLPQSQWETETGGAVQAYDGTDVQALYFLGEEPVLLAAREGIFFLTQQQDAAADVPVLWSGSLCPRAFRQHTDGSLSFYDPESFTLQILKDSFADALIHPLPQDLWGDPAVSDDGRHIYYCAPGQLRVLETDTGISRILRDGTQPGTRISALLLKDTVVCITVPTDPPTPTQRFLSTADGATLGEYRGSLQILGWEDGYWAAGTSLLFGRGTDAPEHFLPRQPQAQCFFLPRHNMALTVTSAGSGGFAAELYDLDSGCRTAALTLPSSGYPRQIQAAPDGSIWILCGKDDPFLRWQSALSPVQDSSRYTSAQDAAPAADTLEQCRLLAEKIGGNWLEVRLPEKPSLSEAALLRQLDILAHSLDAFPPEILQTLAGRFPGLRLQLTEKSAEAHDGCALSASGSCLIWEGNTPVLQLAPGENLERAVYHGLCHLMDTVVLTESTTYDRWDNLNPSAFSYAYSTRQNRQRDTAAFLEPGKESFADAESMVSPQEDRARILEYAMTPGNAARFRSVYMQAKLRQLCLGIREAFALEKAAAVFPWEQYLDMPLAPVE